MNYKIDHIGIAVRNLKESVDFYVRHFGGQMSEVFESKKEGVRVQFVYYENNRLEFLEPTSPDSPIAKFLESHSPGLHHLCYGVANIEAELTRLKKEGLRLIDETPRIGAEGKKIAFIQPKSSGGVLVELKESV